MPVPRAAARTTDPARQRGLIGTSEAQTDRSAELTQQAVELERAAGEPHPRTALLALGAALTRDGRFSEATEILGDAWRSRDETDWSSGVILQLAGLLGLTLLQLGRDADLERLLQTSVPLANAAQRDWGAATGPSLALLRLVEARQLYLPR
jgi:Flp pilus assembly protein TadD